MKKNLKREFIKRCNALGILFFENVPIFEYQNKNKETCEYITDFYLIERDQCVDIRIDPISEVNESYFILKNHNERTLLVLTSLSDIKKFK